MPVPALARRADDARLTALVLVGASALVALLAWTLAVRGLSHDLSTVCGDDCLSSGTVFRTRTGVELAVAVASTALAAAGLAVAWLASVLTASER